MPRAGGVAALAVALALPAAAAEDATRPSVTRPASSPATSANPASAPALAAVDAEARPLLDAIAAHYADGRPLSLRARIDGLFEVAGRRRTYVLDVTGVTDGHGRYRHEARDAGLLTNDGTSAYLYDVRRDSYARLPADAGRQAADGVPASVVAVLLDENPALLLTLTDDAASLLRQASTATVRLADAQPSLPATTASTTSPATRPGDAGIVVTRPGKTVTLWADLRTGALRGSRLDYTPALRDRQTRGVKAARVDLTYVEAGHAPPAADAFSWSPPATATDFTLSDELVRSGAATRPASGPADDD